jgi:hypothetical protein
LGCLLLGTAATSGVAQDSLPRFRFSAMVVFARLETSVRYDFGSGIVGVSVGFESNLGMDPSQTLPALLASYRVGGRHHVIGGYYELGRTGSKSLDADIPLPDTTLTLGSTVESFFNTRVLTLGYGYSLLQTPTSSITPYVAFYVADWDAGIGIQGGLAPLSGEVSLTAPLPMLGMVVHSAIASRLFIMGNLGLFFLRVGDYDGSIIEINAQLAYQLFSFLRIGGGYAIFSVDVTATAPDFKGEVRYKFDGPALSASVSF